MSSQSQGRIMCVGMCVLDIVTQCERYPEEDTDKRCTAGYWQRGGNASNMCTVLRQLGVACEYLGMLSESAAFRFLHEDFRQRDIAFDSCPRTEKDPPFSAVILNMQNGSRTIVHSNMDFPILRHDHFRQSVDLSKYSWIHFEARNPQDTLAMMQDIWAHNATAPPTDRIKVSVEFEKVKEENLVLGNYADVIFLGKDLARHLGWQSMQDAAFGLREKLKPQHVVPAIVVTWGDQGSCSLDAHDNYTHAAPVAPERIVDSLAAGDTFCAACIFALACLKVDIKDAIVYGNRCAELKLAQRGFDHISLEQMSKQQPQ